MQGKIYDIENRQASYDKLREFSNWFELGIRAISVMYDEHSDDQLSKDNIFRLKDNIHYRIISAIHMYGLLLNEIGRAEQFCEKSENKKVTDRSTFSASMYLELFEMEHSAIFDAVIFNIVSAIDYISHIICYICKKQKSETLYWTKLAKSVRDPNNELSKFKCAQSIDAADKRFIGKLYDYRSTLIHKKRERHSASMNHNLMSGKFQIKIMLTSTEMRDFKLIFEDHSKDHKFTLPYLAEWIILKVGMFFKEIFTDLKIDITENSHYHDNIRGANGKGDLVLMYVDPNTNIGYPFSKKLWEQFLKNSPI